MYTVLLVAHTIIVLFLILLVLIQRSSSDGLTGLGGGGGNQFMTGRASANLLTRVTAILAGAFMCTSLILAIMASRMTEGSIVDSTPVEQSAPLAVEKTAPITTPAKPVKKETPSVPKPE
jgi:preprotein translocase subunit SecG